ncbi:electron transport complex subunit C [Desulfosarcina alkanivorans]|uniref:Electron transport complex subunit C n=1 Tax=Desulfosarcina alkanivorans TaxID=571177 RepID=A0A5K7YUM9_9BACT|nr:4Fe-4S dicluster domain-containing protein [Desulfosarcina alkanivorans]BBO71729.1 electron transport complex subunit C [Desulfosarcina alkanivorans]
MRKRSFFGLSKPCFQYELATDAADGSVTIPTPDTVTLYIKQELKRTSCDLKVGTAVKTGQRLVLNDGDTICAISSVTGTISRIEPFLADFGRSWTAVTVKTDGKDTADAEFAEASQTPSLETLNRYLSACPGEPDIAPLMDERNPVHTIVIYAGNADLLIDTSLHVFKQNAEAVNAGIEVLRKATGIEDIVIVVPEESVQNYSGHLDARIEPVSSEYPFAQPLMVLYHLTGRLPDEKGMASMGIYLIRAEAVAAIGQAFSSGVLPVDKMVTVIDKQGGKHLARARVGTPVGNLLGAFGISVNDQDKIIFGGPMTGNAIYSEALPVGPDTDAILVQDKTVIPLYSDYPCINCGDCVRICPANVPVNLLVRFLEAGQYAEGADLYDLYSCIECGLCSYVCVSRIPIYQYIKLAKYELARITSAEEMNEQ